MHRFSAHVCIFRSLRPRPLSNAITSPGCWRSVYRGVFRLEEQISRTVTTAPIVTTTPNGLSSRSSRLADASICLSVYRSRVPLYCALTRRNRCRVAHHCSVTTMTHVARPTASACAPSVSTSKSQNTLPTLSAAFPSPRSRRRIVVVRTEPSPPPHLHRRLSNSVAHPNRSAPGTLAGRE